MASWFDKKWFSNFGTIISTLGFFATIYFGIWYIPAWIKESEEQKIKNAKDEVILAVKELSYSDSTLNINIITSLNKAKELDLGNKLTWTLEVVFIKLCQLFILMILMSRWNVDNF